MLRSAGYDAVGVDTEAPEGADYHRTGIEEFVPPRAVDLVVASRSLHHVADLDDVADRILGMLAAAQLYVATQGMQRVLCAKLHHDNPQRCIFRCNYGARAH